MQVGQVAQVSHGQGVDSVGQVCRHNLTVGCESHASDGSALCIQSLQVSAVRQIDRANQVRAVTHIQYLKQRIVANVQLGHKCVSVTLGIVTDNQLLQLRSLGEVVIVDVTAREVIQSLDAGSTVNQNCSIVHCITQRVLDGIGLTGLSTNLHRGCRVTVENRQVHI